MDKRYDPRAELDWLHAAEQAAADAAGSLVQAAAAWERSARIAEQFPDGDPRRAASLNNQAVGELLVAHARRAASLLDQAEAAWDASASWLAEMRPRARARSSLFHLRLEHRHRARFEQPRRAAHGARLDEGRAAVAANRAALAHHLGRAVEAESWRARAAALCGADTPAHLRAALQPGAAGGVHFTDFSPRAQARGWLVDRPPAFTDEGRLMAALCLSVIVAPVGPQR